MVCVNLHCKLFIHVVSCTQLFCSLESKSFGVQPKLSFKSRPVGHRVNRKSGKLCFVSVYASARGQILFTRLLISITSYFRDSSTKLARSDL